MEQMYTYLQRTVRELFDVGDIEIDLTRPRAEFGDFSTNVAMTLAKQVGKSPRDIAIAITEALLANETTWLASAEVAGPGFINLRLRDSYLLTLVEAPVNQPLTGQKVVIETNNPNPFKDIHIGHAMNAIVSDTIANLLEAGGANVHRVSYHGDVGLHVAKSLWAIKNEYPDNAAGQLAATPPAERARKLREWYAKGATAHKEDADAREAIESLTKETFAFTDPALQAVYDTCKQWSFDYFDQVFSELGSKPVEKRYLESDADAEGRKLVEAHIGDVFEESNGAIVFPGEKYGLHTRVFIASRGTTLYEARDLGLMVLKDRDFNPDMSYIVTADEQKEYFRVVLKAAGMVSPHLDGKTTNISTGMVRLTTGKMSSRTGEAVNIAWLFDNLREAVKARGAHEDVVDLSIQGALRYSLLKNRFTSDTIFDINQSVSLEGNTGPYLQYAHARARSILSKSAQQPAALDDDTLTPDERAFVSKLSQYREELDRAISELMPHHLCTYLFELCKDFNSFYEKNRVIGDEREAVRLGLVALYSNILHAGLNILGITAPEHM